MDGGGWAEARDAQDEAKKYKEIAVRATKVVLESRDEIAKLRALLREARPRVEQAGIYYGGIFAEGYVKKELAEYDLLARIDEALG